MFAKSIQAAECCFPPSHGYHLRSYLVAVEVIPAVASSVVTTAYSIESEQTVMRVGAEFLTLSSFYIPWPRATHGSELTDLIWLSPTQVLRK